MTFTVYGNPAPQGSKRHVGAGVMVESSKLVKPWRTAVEQAVMLMAPMGGRGSQPILVPGPVTVVIAFTLHRPKSKKKEVKPATRPDIDKLTRSTFDALKTAGVYEDDGRIVDLCVTKRYPAQGADSLPVPGAVIHVDPSWWE